MLYSAPHGLDTEAFSASTQSETEPIPRALVLSLHRSTSLVSRSSQDDNSSSSGESDMPGTGATDSQPQSPLEDYTSYAQLILCMAKTLQLDVEISQQEKDLVFHDMVQDKTPPPSLSLIPALLDLVKTSWDKSSLTPQIPQKIECHYKTHGSDSDFLVKHPVPNSIMVEATQYKSHSRSSTTPVNRAGRKIDSLGKKVLFSCRTND